MFEGHFITYTHISVHYYFEFEVEGFFHQVYCATTRDYGAVCWVWWLGSRAHLTSWGNQLMLYLDPTLRNFLVWPISVCPAIWLYTHNVQKISCLSSMFVFDWHAKIVLDCLNIPFWSCWYIGVQRQKSGCNSLENLLISCDLCCLEFVLILWLSLTKYVDHLIFGHKHFTIQTTH